MSLRVFREKNPLVLGKTVSPMISSLAQLPSSFFSFFFSFFFLFLLLEPMDVWIVASASTSGTSVHVCVLMRLPVGTFIIIDFSLLVSREDKRARQ